MEGGFRVDDTPVHRELREALVNCIINTDFYGKYGILIIKEENKIVFENPGYIRLGKEDFDPDRTSLTLKFIKKQAIKASDRSPAKRSIMSRQEGRKLHTDNFDISITPRRKTPPGVYVNTICQNGYRSNRRSLL